MHLLYKREKISRQPLIDLVNLGKQEYSTHSLEFLLSSERKNTVLSQCNLQLSWRNNRPTKGPLTEFCKATVKYCPPKLAITKEADVDLKQSYRSPHPTLKHRHVPDETEKLPDPFQKEHPSHFPLKASWYLHSSVQYGSSDHQAISPQWNQQCIN